MANIEKIGKSFYTIIPDGVSDLIMDFFIIPKSLKIYGVSDDILTILEIVEDIAESLWPEIKLKIPEGTYNTGCLFLGNRPVKFKIPASLCTFASPSTTRITFER